MRSDARALLEKLSQQGFQYQQFPDPYEDMELWPIFEALLNDERFVGQKLSRVQQREHEFQAIKHKAAKLPQDNASTSSASAPLAEEYTSLLSTYGDEGERATVPTTSSEGQDTPRKIDLRTFLGQLEGKAK